MHKEENNMLDTIFTTTVSETLTFGGTVLIILSALALGFGISLVYKLTHRRCDCSGSFLVTLIMLPAIIAMIILLVGSNIARAFSLAGAFSLIRFRSAPGDAKDIAYVFFTLGVGLACGMGYIAYAALFAFILCAVMVVLYFAKFGAAKKGTMRVKILIPEDMNYAGVFDEVLEKFTSHYALVRIKTTDFGSLFELVYEIVLKEKADAKAFLDQLRCLNGNLSITLTQKETGGDAL